MSMPQVATRQFSRPVEYDPTLALEPPPTARGSGAPALSKADVLKDEFGFEESSSEEEEQEEDDAFNLDENGEDGGAFELKSDSDSDEEYGGVTIPATARGRPKGGYGHGSAAMEAQIAELEAAHQEEIDRLTSDLAEWQSRALRAEESASQTEARMEELSNMSKAAKNILVNKFRQQLKTLMQQVEEQKTMLAEDDETLESLRESNAKLAASTPGASQEFFERLQATLRELKEVRQVSKQNISLRAQVEDSQNMIRNLQQELEESQKAAEAAQEAAATATANAAAAASSNGSTTTAAAAAPSPSSSSSVTDSTELVSSLRSKLSSVDSERQRLQQQVEQLTKHLNQAKQQIQVADSRAAQAEAQAQKHSTVPAAAAVPAPTQGRNVEQAVAEALAEERAKATEEITRMAQDQAQITEAKQALEKQVQTLQSQVQELQTSLATAQKQAAESAAVAEAATAQAAAATAAAAATPKIDPTQVAEAAAAAANTAAQLQAAQERETQLSTKLAEVQTLLAKKESDLAEVRDKAKEKLTTASNAIKKLKTEYGNLRNLYQKLREEHAQVNEATSNRTAEGHRRKQILDHMQRTISGSRSSIQSLKEDVANLSQDLPSLGPAITQAITKFVSGRSAEHQQLLASYRKELALRRQLFNQIQELKGNIRVYCRVRPPNDREQSSMAITFPNENELSIYNPEKKSTHNFEFERIFDPSRTQADIFAEVSDLITSALDGYAVCIFAYGQTGSGKTHTMQGPKDDPGVNIRALTRLFEVAADRAPDIRYEIKVTLLEIYNEKIQDLLGEKGRVLKAVQGAYGMEVQDLTMVPVSNEKEVLDTLKKGSRNRSVSSTNMNDVSSRSHLILSVYILAKNSLTGKETMGKLHLIDLAGSERVGRSGVTGDAMKEAQSINQSLSALGNVIAARANKAAHVPYRDSTLTYLLQDSLEKNSKTLMFVALSPSASDAGESLCSLRFAERVRKVELGESKATVRKR